MLVSAIVIITLALVFYTIGVWSERIQGTLKRWHAAAFGLGLACDLTGTFLMSRIAAEATGSASGLTVLMAVSGTIALLLMAVHLAWAVIVLIRDREAERANFHKFSIVVWAIWLVPYASGAVSSM
jgi:uncharacterized repeat protein (TIGR03987 family)